MPFEKLLHALKIFPEEATDPDVLLSLAFSFKVKHLLQKFFSCQHVSLWIHDMGEIYVHH
jgi:hypothetical protein